MHRLSYVYLFDSISCDCALPCLHEQRYEPNHLLIFFSYSKKIPFKLQLRVKPLFLSMFFTGDCALPCLHEQCYEPNHLRIYEPEFSKVFQGSIPQLQEAANDTSKRKGDPRLHTTSS